jgi:hypothetical protein
MWVLGGSGHGCFPPVQHWVCRKRQPFPGWRLAMPGSDSLQPCSPPSTLALLGSITCVCLACPMGGVWLGGGGCGLVWTLHVLGCWCGCGQVWARHASCSGSWTTSSPPASSPPLASTSRSRTSRSGTRRSSCRCVWRGVGATIFPVLRPVSHLASVSMYGNQGWGCRGHWILFVCVCMCVVEAPWCAGTWWGPSVWQRVLHGDCCRRCVVVGPARFGTLRVRSGSATSPPPTSEERRYGSGEGSDGVMALWLCFLELCGCNGPNASAGT